MIDNRSLPEQRLKTPESITREVWEHIFTRLQTIGKMERFQRRIRPVYCRKCGRHYTIMKPDDVPWAPTVVHLDCAACGGKGVPLTLEAPR